MLKPMNLTCNGVHSLSPSTKRNVMKVLMFGWEFPPHILGGLGTASYGITKGLSLQPDVHITFCLPKPWGDEDKSFMNIIGMSETPVVWRDVDYDYVKQRLGDRMSPELYYQLRDNIYADFNYRLTDDLGCIEFSGRYPDNLQDEINNYSIVAGVIARQQEYDIMCVSELTRQTVINHYHQDPAKVVTMHNAVYPLSSDILNMVEEKRKAHEHRKEKVVTFLGRITMQKGPEYFVEAASLVLQRTHNIRFCMAGSGDMMNDMINMVAARGIADRFHFPGFMRGKQVYEAFADSDVYVMPSVSEPFGISPLEAMQCGVPSIISKQSGCAEILDKCIKTDYWDINAMADAMYSICTNESLHEYLKVEGKKEVDQITWEKVGKRIYDVYCNLIK